MRDAGSAARRRAAIRSAATLLASGLLALAAAPAAAQEAERDPDAVTGSLTLGVGAGPDYEGSNDYQVLPAPGFRVNWRGYGAFSQGPALYLDLLPQAELLGGPLVGYRFGRDDVDDGRVDALPDVDGAIELGAFLGFSLPLGEDPRERFSAILSYSRDISGAHDGFLISGSLSSGFVLARPLGLTLGTSLTYASENYQDTYFGVSSAGAAASGLRAYDPSGGLKDASLRASLSYSLSPSWSLGPTVIYKRLLEDAADSPLVEEAGSADQFIGSLSTTWRF
ncbi:MAG: MipA/OmpV family protein [Tistlia sp.]|uniref:MipA/OmpV family protein n=1 Tax=Tistlia sp. TaxID=3057121 RepID=UPI0034A44A5D